MKHLLIGMLLGMLMASAVSYGESELDEQMRPEWWGLPPGAFQPLPPMPKVYGAPKTYDFQNLNPC